MDAIDESVIPGFEKFTTVQNVLDQNKYALALSSSSLRIRIASRCRVYPQDCRRTLFGCRILINEINANHEARTPEGLARNVVLIKELNSNVSKVSNTT